MADAYPLQWPDGRARFSGHRVPNGNFKMSDSAMVGHLLDELDRLKASDVVISTNKAPYSRSQAKLEDPGVAVYFTRKGQQICIACDKWSKVEDNIHAIGLCVEAIRGMERWGTTDMVDAAFSGYTALPATASEHRGPRAWHDVLGVASDSSPAVIRAAYKSKALVAHPDKGGSRADWDELQNAYRESGASDAS